MCEVLLLLKLALQNPTSVNHKTLLWLVGSCILDGHTLVINITKCIMVDTFGFLDLVKVLQLCVG